MTRELIEKLMAAGLTKQQATSVTAQTITELYMSEDSKLLISEAARQVRDMQKVLQEMYSDYRELRRKISDTCDVISALSKAQNDFGTVTEESAKNVVALYGALLNMNESKGACGTDSVRDASYVLYAYLGGQAKREITYPYNKSDK